MIAAQRIEMAALSRRIPLHGSAELTWRCNFGCVHCYQEGLRRNHRELDTAQWKSLFEEFAAAGCLNLTLTGGEPLVRKDFAELYEHAHRLGFLLTVFTNASMLDEEILELWSRRPPYSIEVTLYGMSEERYVEVAKRRAHRRVMAAIDALVERKMPLTLKTVAMRPLAGELEQMRAFAKSKGVRFRWDSSITPRLDGNRAPQAYMLSPQDRHALDQSDPKRAEMFSATCTGAQVPNDDVLTCGSTRVAFNIDPSGNVTGCVLLRKPSANALNGFAQAWEALAPMARMQSAKEAGSCGTCSSRSVCNRCPGTSLLEKGSYEKPTDRDCELTQLRFGQRRAG